MKHFVRLILILLVSLISANINAQSTGDKLFTQGQNYQQIMTLKAQTQAIELFKKAKLAYDSATKKVQCDKQIKVCQNIIKAAPWKKAKQRPVAKNKPGGATPQSVDNKDEVETVEVDNTELSLSTSSLSFKAKGGTGTVTVKCNKSDWKVNCSADWIKYSVEGSELKITVDKNKTKEIRSGIIKVTHGTKESQLTVTQDINFTNRVKNIF